MKESKQIVDNYIFSIAHLKIEYCFVWFHLINSETEKDDEEEDEE